jgi:hypothetical protein
MRGAEEQRRRRSEKKGEERAKAEETELSNGEFSPCWFARSHRSVINSKKICFFQIDDRASD